MRERSSNERSRLNIVGEKTLIRWKAWGPREEKTLKREGTKPRRFFCRALIFLCFSSRGGSCLAKWANSSPKWPNSSPKWPNSPPKWANSSPWREKSQNFPRRGRVGEKKSQNFPRRGRVGEKKSQNFPRRGRVGEKKFGFLTRGILAPPRPGSQNIEKWGPDEKNAGA